MNKHMNEISNVNTIRGTITRLCAEGFRIPENALRTWVKEKKIPARQSGSTFYIFYPNVIDFLTSGREES